MSVRLQGLALFAFIPIVLILFLAQPLGTVASLLIGIVLMFGHRFVAVPFVQKHRHQRCLWCGRPGQIGPAGDRAELRDFEVLSPVTGSGTYAVCSRGAGRSCASRWDALYTLADRFRLLIRLGIGIPVIYLLGSELVRGTTGTELWTGSATTVQIFKGVVALTVVSISVVYLAYRRSDDSVSGEAEGRVLAAPVHNLGLLGAGWTLWIFRVVGVWWLVRILFGQL